MPIVLAPRLTRLLADRGAVKVLATSDRSGRPHAVLVPDLHLRADGRLVHLERIESSRTQKNLVASLWFDRPVAVTVAHGGESWEIEGRAVKVLIAGPEFRDHYERVRESSPEADLAAAWIVEPTAATELTYEVRRAFHEVAHPFSTHLDRLAR